MDPGILELVGPEEELITFLLEDEFSPSLIFNLVNSTFGRGVLVGMLVEAIGNYYQQMQLDESEDNEDLI